jgi:hypothetical protein
MRSSSTPPATSLDLEPTDTPRHPLAPWFAGFRQARRAHYATRTAPAARRSRAVITMVHDESVFLPLWLAYYGRWFRPDELYVLDNDTTDGSTDAGGFVRIPVHHETVDHRWMVERVQDLQHELLETKDVVLVTDVDELIVANPRHGDLGEYVQRFDEPFVNCLGYELLHQADREPPLDLGLPILQQRGFWFFNGGYDKAALATEPMQWRTGFHGREDFAMNTDPDLRLVHLHRMDYELCLARHRTRNRKPWAPADAASGWARHNQITDDVAFARWFAEDSCFENFAIQLEPIPADWRGVF